MRAALQLMRMRPLGRLAAACLAFAIAALPWSAPARAQTYTPYSVFQAMTPAQLATLQVKLTWIGPVDAPLATRAGISTTGTVNLGLFTPFQRPGFDYGSDFVDPVSFKATTAQLKAVIDSVATLPGVTDGGVDAAGLLSFALLNTVGGTKCFESIVDETNGRALFARMRGALAANASAVLALDEMACETGMAPITPAADHTGDVSITMTGVRLDRKTGQFVGRVRVTNSSASLLPAPLSLVANVQANVSLAGGDGRTCRVDPVGRPYVNLAVGAGLAPGAFVEKVLRFNNPDLEKIEVDWRVVAGPGAR